ncbi:uncharacterized protein LOC120274163 [Dioscorea cayenensis subsp. rotundata]|uniref:Uncharacterized protein LOC120274163 n=1 Tax=Dioscorea cayennensis subsp. rotundata TaxID=55577 RepID=A0AB40CEZ9_DIOCR|nr:uncharacterized protein LOC120274163 [Dioscorea cayenensis subsp. rotundata]
MNHVREYSHSKFSQNGKQLIINNFSYTDSPFLFVATAGNYGSDLFGAGFFIADSNSQFIFASCCNNPAESIIEAEALALLAALGCIFVFDLQIKTIFIASFELHGFLKAGNHHHSWRLNPLLTSINDYLAELGCPQLHIIPHTWMTAAASLALHGLNSHVLTLFHQGRELPYWLMKQLKKNGITL